MCSPDCTCYTDEDNSTRTIWEEYGNEILFPYKRNNDTLRIRNEEDTFHTFPFKWSSNQSKTINTHQVHHPNILNPNHIDASIMPLRPGLLLATPPVLDDCKVMISNCTQTLSPVI